MKLVDKFFEHIYFDADFGRNIAISLSGLLGLSVYLLLDDWVISVFTFVIIFPVSRLIASSIHKQYLISKNLKLRESEAIKILSDISEREWEVISAFVDKGGAVMTFREINESLIPHNAIETLVNRGVMHTSVMSDGMTETFVLDTTVYDFAKRKLGF